MLWVQTTKKYAKMAANWEYQDVRFSYFSTKTYVVSANDKQVC